MDNKSFFYTRRNIVTYRTMCVYIIRRQYTLDPNMVPEHAEVCYKAVAVRDGRMLSIFDGVTEYRLDELTHKSSGLWACPSLAALEHGQKFHCSQRPAA